MRVSAVVAFLLAVGCVSAFAEAPPASAKASAADQLPAELARTYADLIQAMESGDPRNIQKFLVADAVTITGEPRPKESAEYGQDINLPFIKHGFQKEIASVRKDADDQYLIRTNSTAMWFVHTRESGWRLNKYLDKPIE